SVSLERVQLAFKDDGVDHHAVTDEVKRVFIENSRRDCVQDILLPIEFERMTSVGTALETGDEVVFRTEYIDYFSFTFVAPLQTQKHINLHSFIRIVEINLP